MKKSIFAILFVSLLSFSFGIVLSTSWVLDSAHSRLGFKVLHMGISDANGAFDKVTCSVTTANDQDFVDATFDLTADASSINTGLSARDNHLKSEDFFAVSQYLSLIHI